MRGHNYFDLIAGWIAGASILSLLLPPIEVFDGYPKFQKGYSLLVRIVSYYGALNLRGKIAAAYIRSNGAKSDAATSAN